MRSSLFRLLPIIPTLILVTTLPNTATACEGECITGVTNAWKTNYTKPLYDVLFTLVSPLYNLSIIRRAAHSFLISGQRNRQ